MRLSVIIPGHNTPKKWWCRCLYSVRQACGPDDEIICVDDGSKECPCFLNDIAKEDARVKPIFLQQNVGQSAARNAALDKAKGDWIAFVDADDRVPPQWLGDTGQIGLETPFGNENCAGREPLRVPLKAGWNWVLLKLPVGAFSTPEVRLVKWMFTFAFVD